MLSKRVKQLEGRDFLREKVRKRDNFTCQICDKVWDKESRRFDVHHLDKELEGKEGKKYENNKNLDRMITLCHKCHLNLKHIRNKMQKVIKMNEQKLKLIKELRNEGITFEEIGKLFNVSRQRIYQICSFPQR